MTYIGLHTYGSPVTETRGNCESGSLISPERIIRNHLARAWGWVRVMPSPHVMLHLLSAHSYTEWPLQSDCQMTSWAKHTEREALEHSNQETKMGSQIRNEGADFTFYKRWEGMTSEHLNCENTSHLVGKTRLKNKRTTIIEKNLNLGSTSQLHGNSN